MLRYLSAILTLLLASVAMAADPSPRLKGVEFKDGIVRIQFTEATTWHSTAWRSANRFIVDVTASGGGARLSTLPVDASRLKAVRWTQFKPETVRVVLDLNHSGMPTVVSRPPADTIEIRLPGAELPPPQPAAAEEAPSVSRPAAATPAVTPTRTAASPAASQTPRIEDITVERGEDGRPQRIVVQTNRTTEAKPKWRGSRLVVSLPGIDSRPERIVPVNDETCIRIHTARENGHAVVIVDFTSRVRCEIQPLSPECGFAITLDLAAPSPEALEPSLRAVAGKEIVVDPGHGGRDTGTRGPYVIEKEANLDIAQRLERVLTSNGARVILTRSDDTLTPLQRRPLIAMEAHADAFISIHCNYASANHHGVEIWHRRDDEESRQLATDLYGVYLRATGFSGRGVKPESRAPEGGLAVLKHNTVPCALVELGFVNDPVEGKALAQPEWRQKAAEALASGLAQYLERQR